MTNGDTITYAAGLSVDKWRGVRQISHSGATAGYRAWLGRFPDQDVSVAVLCNVASANAPLLGHEVAAIYLGPALERTEIVRQELPDEVLKSRAGLYRNLRDNTAVSVQVADGGLRLQSTVLTPVSDRRFVAARGLTVEFSADGQQFTAGDPGESASYRRVEPAKPTPADLAAYSGEYRSAEAAITYRAVVENGQLVIRYRPNGRIPLRPTYRDAFDGPGESVRFLREASGKVTEMSVGNSRAWDVRFRRTM